MLDARLEALGGKRFVPRADVNRWGDTAVFRKVKFSKTATTHCIIAGGQNFRATALHALHGSRCREDWGAVDGWLAGVAAGLKALPLQPAAETGALPSSQYVTVDSHTQCCSACPTGRCTNEEHHDMLLHSQLRHVELRQSMLSKAGPNLVQTGDHLMVIMLWQGTVQRMRLASEMHQRRDGAKAAHTLGAWLPWSACAQSAASRTRTP